MSLSQSKLTSAFSLQSFLPRCVVPRFFSAILLNFLYLVLCVLASPFPQNNFNNQNNTTPRSQLVENPTKYLPNCIPAGIIAIVFGVIFCFWGARWFKVALFLGGFYVFASIAFFVLETAEPSTQYGNRSAVYYGVIIAVGILGGMLTTFLVKLGVFAIGCIGGYSLALWILALNTDGTISTIVGQKVFIAAMALVGGCLTLFVLLDSAVKIFTSIAGAYSIVLGIDMFANTGFRDSASRFLGSGDVVYNLQKTTIYMLVAVPVLAILGMLVQFRLTARGQKSGFLLGK